MLKNYIFDKIVIFLINSLAKSQKKKVRVNAYFNADSKRMYLLCLSIGPDVIPGYAKTLLILCVCSFFLVTFLSTIGSKVQNSMK